MFVLTNIFLLCFTKVILAHHCSSPYLPTKAIHLNEYDFRKVEKAATTITSNQDEIYYFLREAGVSDKGPMKEYYKSETIPPVVEGEINSCKVSDHIRAILNVQHRVKDSEIAEYSRIERLHCLASDQRVAKSHIGCDFSGKDACLYGLFGKCLSYDAPGAGSAFLPYEHLTQPHPSALDYKPSDCPLFSARTISNNLVETAALLPKSKSNLPNLFVLYLLEFYSYDSAHAVYDTIHDGGLAPTECTKDQKTSLPQVLLTPRTSKIQVSCKDEFYGQFDVRCLNFVRTQKVQKTCGLDQSATLNRGTSLLDMDHFYTARINGHPDFAQGPDGKYLTDVYGNFIFGDKRAVHHSSLLLMYNFHARLHNLLVDGLRAQCHFTIPVQLFDRAKIILTAIYQKILVNDLLELLIGKSEIRQLQRTHYHPSVNPVTYSDWACGAAHVLHKFIQDDVYLADQNYVKESTVSLRYTYYNEYLVRDQADSLARGLLSQEWNHGYSGETHGHLFHNPDLRYGHDLQALSINRARDCGLKPYNSYLQIFFNDCVTSFSDLKNHIQDDNVDKVYKNVDEIEAAYAMPLEPPVEDGFLGKTAAKIYYEQYEKLIAGDPKFYSNLLKRNELNAIERVTLGDLLCLAFGLDSIPNDARYPESKSNKLRRCGHKTIGDVIDLSQFCYSEFCSQ